MYISSDRIDIQYTCKTLARRVQDPTDYSLISLKRLFRFLVGHKKMEYLFHGHLVDFQTVTVFVDSDWAGDRLSRKSTTGGIVLVGSELSSSCIMASYSRTQNSVALSSTEAELQAIVSGVGEGVFVQSLITELGFSKPSLIVCTDSKGAYDNLKRLGVGRIKHVALRSLFVQELVHNNTVSLRKVSTLSNPADLLTKPVSSSTLFRLLSLLPIRCCDWPTRKDEVNEDE